MSDCFIGEIRLWPGLKCPTNWAICDGSSLAINANQVLYALIGVTYGGDGLTSFNLPDLRGRVPVGQGTGAAHGAPTPRVFGKTGGAAKVVLTTDQLPLHSHSVSVSTAAATTTNPTGALLAGAATGYDLYQSDLTGQAMVELNTATIGTTTGGGLGHDNVMPTVNLNYIISLQGIYPTPN
jgi:microcystin-dependent protein